MNLLRLLLRFFRGENGHKCEWLVEDLFSAEECVLAQLGWTVEQDHAHDLVVMSFGRDTDLVVQKFNLTHHRRRRPRSKLDTNYAYQFCTWKKKEYELLFQISQYADELHAQHRAKRELI